MEKLELKKYNLKGYSNVLEQFGLLVIHILDIKI